MSSLANPSIAMEPCQNYNVHYDSTRLPQIEIGQRKNMKIVAPGGKRLKAMVQLVKNNRGSVNTYTLGKNRVNYDKDPEANEDLTPVLVTAHTIPQFPCESESFLCSGK